MKIYDQFDHKPPFEGLVFDKPSVARQEFEPECNIHNILAKFKVTGVLVDPSIKALRKPMFGDFTGLPDLADYHDMLGKVKDAFGTLPQVVRDAFADDPGVAMAWFARASDSQIKSLWQSVGLNPAQPISKQAEPVAKPVEASAASIAAPKDDKGAA